MASFNEVFDVKTLDDFQLGHLQYILTSPSYSEVFQPYLVHMRNSLSEKLLDPDERRKEQYPCDFLRGGILMIDGLLSLFNNLIQETEIERIARTQVEMTERQQYDLIRQTGGTHPMNAIKDYDDNDDF